MTRFEKAILAYTEFVIGGAGLTVRPPGDWDMWVEP
jgi:hypothetical protein